MALRLRTTENMYSVPLVTERWSTYVNPMVTCSEFKKTSESVLDMPKNLGIKKQVFDEYPSTWNRKTFAIRDFEIRSASGGADSTKAVLKIASNGCPPRTRYVLKGPIALYGESLYYNLAPVTTNLEEAYRALQDAWSAVTDPEIDFGENIAEMDNSLKMILDPLKAAANILRKGAKGLPRALNLLQNAGKKPGRSTKKALDHLENWWLQARYGFMPLALDVSAGIKMYNERFVVRPEIKVAHGGIPVRKTRVLNRSQWGLPLPLTYANCVTDVTTGRKIRACVFHRNTFGDRSAGEALRSFGLNPSQLPRLAWNLLPLSFVVDWSWDVSSFISMLDPVADKAILGNCVSTKETELRIIRIESYTTSNPNYTTTGSPCQASGSTRKYKRECNIKSPIKLLRGADLSTVKRTIDALALAAQNIPRLFRR